MARVRMVTRTVEVTVAQVMCVDVSTAEVSVRNYEVSGKFADDSEVLKALKKAYETDSYKVVAVQNTEVKEILYGMPEIEFIRMAKVLPPRCTQGSSDEDD